MIVVRLERDIRVERVVRLERWAGLLVVGRAPPPLLRLLRLDLRRTNLRYLTF